MKNSPLKDDLTILFQQTKFTQEDKLIFAGITNINISEMIPNIMRKLSVASKELNLESEHIKTD